MARGKPRSAKEKAKAFELFAQDQTNAEVARTLGLPETTTHAWLQEWIGTEDFEKARSHRRTEEGMLARRIHRTVSVKLLQKLMEDRISDDKLPVLYGIATEKMLLLDGAPTERTEHLFNLSDEEAEEIAERYKRILESENEN